MTVGKKMLSVGYNEKGQGFFDVLKKYRKYIHSWFFSPTHMMTGETLHPESVFTRLSVIHTYDIPANLTINYESEQHRFREYIEAAKKSGINLTSVTVIAPWAAERIKIEYPDLEVHCSIRYLEWAIPRGIDVFDKLVGKFDVVNVATAYQFNDRDFVKRLHDNGIKSKFIVNERCIINRTKNYACFPGFEETSCGSGKCSVNCDNVTSHYPWMELARLDTHKEDLEYMDHDILKISTRFTTTSNEDIANILQYWTSEGRTTEIGVTRKIPIINDEKYDVFKKYVFARSQCKGDCFNCKVCEMTYLTLVYPNLLYITNRGPHSDPPIV